MVVCCHGENATVNVGARRLCMESYLKKYKKLGDRTDLYQSFVASVVKKTDICMQEIPSIVSSYEELQQTHVRLTPKCHGEEHSYNLDTRKHEEVRHWGEVDDSSRHRIRYRIRQGLRVCFQIDVELFEWVGGPF